MTTAPPLRGARSEMQRAPSRAPRLPRVATARRTRRIPITILIPIVIGLMAFLPRVLSVGGASADEPRWLARSDHYISAYLSLDLTKATSTAEGGGTMPGITTSLVGGIAKGLWAAGRQVGVIESEPYPFAESRQGLFIAQNLMALVNALLVVALWWVLRQLIGLRPATVAAAILATEPFLVAHGARLTTDSFVTLFAAIGCFALAAALGIPRPIADSEQRRRLAVVAGIGLAGAFASKISALTLVPFVVAVIAIAIARRNSAPERRSVLGVVVATTLAGIATLFVLWPALWTDPGGQFDVLSTSAEQIGIERRQFFFGEVTRDPGVFFYPVVVAFRSTPWLFLLTLAAPLAFIDRARRPVATLMVAYCLVPFLVVASAGLKYDRYALPFWPALAVLAALTVEHLIALVVSRAPILRRAMTPIVIIGVIFAWFAVMKVTPDTGVYANPALGGGPAAQGAILIGGPATSRAGELIREREGDACGQRRIYATVSRGRLRFPCGQVVRSVDRLRPGDYIVVDTGSLTRGQATLDEYRDRGDVVAHIRRRGVDLADLIQVR